jgi:Ca2+-binding RTX toxin-like protein
MVLFVTTANQITYQQKGATPGLKLGGADTLVLLAGATISASNETVGQLVTLSSYGIDLISSYDSLLLMGWVQSQSSSGIFSNYHNQRIMIASTGVVNGGTYGIYLSNVPDQNGSSGGNLVENQGLVIGAGPVGAGIVTCFSNNFISNTGRVEGQKGIVAGTIGSSNNKVVNSGSISTSKEGVILYGDGSSLTNSGVIKANGYLGEAAIVLKAEVGETITVLNTGTILSDYIDNNDNLIDGDAIVGSKASDRVINSGTIVGDIYLDDGANLYDGRGGIVIGAISGGINNDTVYGGVFDGPVYLDEGDDLFDGRSEISNTNIVLGAGNDIAYGGAGNETFQEFDGNDYINGGSGVDTLILVDQVAVGIKVDLRVTTTQKISAIHGADRIAEIENVTADAGDDEIIGTGESNELLGNDGSDTLEGGLGDDTLDGGGGKGYDYARFTGSTAATVDLNNSAPQTTGYGSDKLIGIEGLIGGSGADSFIGDVNTNRFYGNAGNDVLSGGMNNDTLHGGTGNDKLTGGTQADAFVFDTGLNAKTNVDTITDFAKEDSIYLENAIFKKLGAGSFANPAKLSKSYFVTGTKAKDKNDYIVYDKVTGALYYDADGSGKGVAVKFAQLKKGIVLAYDDFLVI